jgi:predicted ATPase/class 3 adenylate cyclase
VERVDAAATARDLPSGTVTFLFTDIEGSTALLGRLGNRYADLQAAYRGLLRAGFAAHGGVEVDTQGDAFFVAFRSARAAVAAAVAAQRAVAEHPWPDNAMLRTRMALHTGEAIRGREGYVGMDVHRAARICAAGHGGQVLLSESTRALVAHDLPDGIGLRDLGEHRLKDLAQPQRLFQLIVPGLPADFPPLRSLGAFPNNLPRLLTSFVGRDRELADVNRLMSRSFLLTLTGPGGSGKTRLAIQVAADALEQFKDGVWLVELGALADPDLITQAAASVVGVREVAGRPLEESLLDHLRPKHLLLILDNCEHLVAACARFAGDILRACPQVRILTTSREALGITGELAYPVPSLFVPDLRTASAEEVAASDAVRLFEERATFSRPEFRLGPGNVAAVAQVCHRLDGIPLAIELAAARVKVLSVEELAARLDDRFRLLTGGSRTALPRHQTLQAAIDWSHALLTAAEQALFRRLCVFAGGFSLDAAEAVCAGDEVAADGVLDLLVRLVEKSLINAEMQAGGTRYRMLETMRQYARDRLLESGEGAAVRARHLQWYLDLAERARPELERPDQVAWLDRLEREHDNMRAALEWGLETGPAEAALRLASALQPFWFVRGYLTEGAGWVERAIAQRADTPAAVQAAALGSLGILLEFWRGDYERARGLFQESLELFRSVDDKEGMSKALFRLALSGFDDAEAEGLFEQSLSLSREVGTDVHTARVMVNLAGIAHRKGHQQRAGALFDESLSLARRTGDKWVLMLVLENLADVALGQGEYDQAAALGKESLTLAAEMDHKWWIYVNLTDLAEVALGRAQPERAARLLGAAERLRKTIGLQVWPQAQADFDRRLARSRAALGEAAFQAAWAAGESMSPAETMAYALREPPV